MSAAVPTLLPSNFLMTKYAESKMYPICEEYVVNNMWKVLTKV